MVPKSKFSGKGALPMGNHRIFSASQGREGGIKGNEFHPEFLGPRPSKKGGLGEYSQTSMDEYKDEY
jgi:hypothetical protein|tara:strand:- start:266 stop:466 length:201 start_codon:yes stop_codon:yes gene_type:complete